MRKMSLIVGSVLLASLLLNVYLFAGRCRMSRAPTPADAQWTAQAELYRAEQEQVPVEVIRRLNQAAIVYFKDQVCVGLSPAIGVVGGKTAVCFDPKTRKVVRDESTGE